MRKRFLLGCCLGLLLLPAAEAGAVSIALLPSLSSVGVGDALGLEVVIAGLGDGVAPSLGSYDLDVSYDPALLSFGSVEFGSLLGGPADSLQSAAGGAGVVDFAELSLLSPAELDALQGGSFTLATLHFTAIGAGASSLSVTQALAGNGVGRPLTVESVAGARVVAGAIPEPAAAALFGLGALALVHSLRARRSG
jgi:hypothetical protein